MVRQRGWGRSGRLPARRHLLSDDDERAAGLVLHDLGWWPSVGACGWARGSRKIPLDMSRSVPGGQQLACVCRRWCDVLMAMLAVCVCVGTTQRDGTKGLHKGTAATKVGWTAAVVGGVVVGGPKLSLPCQASSKRTTGRRRRLAQSQTSRVVGAPKPPASSELTRPCAHAPTRPHAYTPSRPHAFTPSHIACSRYTGPPALAMPRERLRPQLRARRLY